MNFFLKLKHWQMFLIWIGGIVQMKVFITSDFWFISVAIYVVLIFGWMYSIGKVLNKNNAELTKKLNIWSVAYLVAMIPFVINNHNKLNQSYEEVNLFVLLAFGILGLIAIVNVVLISSRTLKETDNSGKLTFRTYALEFFLIIYGYWSVGITTKIE